MGLIFDLMKLRIGLGKNMCDYLLNMKLTAFIKTLPSI